MRITTRSARVAMACAAMWAGTTVLAAEQVVLPVGHEPQAQYRTIQAALDAAPEGAIVRVGQGEFDEEVIIRRPVVLEGAGWERTVIAPPQVSVEEAAQALQDAQVQAAGRKDSQDQAAIMRELRDKLRRTAIRIEGTKGVVVRGIKVAGRPGNPETVWLMPDGLVVLERAGATISRCAIVGSPGCGILILDGSDADVRHSLIAGMWNTGIVVGERDRQKVRATIADCDVRNCYYTGVIIAPGQQATVQRCRISGAAWHGIRYDDASPTIEGNRIFANARCGIYASGGTAATVKDNLLAGNEMTGMWCLFANADTVSGNTFACNGREGLAVSGASRPAVERNIFCSQPSAIVCSSLRDEPPEAQNTGSPRPRENIFWKNGTNVKRLEADFLTSQPAAAQGGAEEVDPGFVDPGHGNYALSDASPARKKGIGAARPLPEPGPWPIQEAERAIIPDGPGRDSKLWKTGRPDARPATQPSIAPVTPPPSAPALSPARAPTPDAAGAAATPPAASRPFPESLAQYHALVAELDAELAAYRASMPLFAHFSEVYLKDVIPLIAEGEKAQKWLEDASKGGAKPDSSNYEEPKTRQARLNILATIYKDVYPEFSKAMLTGRLTMDHAQGRIYFGTFLAHFRAADTSLSRPLTQHYPDPDKEPYGYRLFARDLMMMALPATIPLRKMVEQIPPDLQEKQGELSQLRGQLVQHAKTPAQTARLPAPYVEPYLKKIQDGEAKTAMADKRPAGQ
jgi:hypothetical protein